jgi:glycosyltransferase involved in cell wall biosynthesis
LKKVSIVIPVYNEVENLNALISAVGQAMLPTGRPFELILVDDGSRDGSESAMQELEKHHSWLTCLSLIRNYGQSTALQAGFDHANGDYIVTLDGDLQNDPNDIPVMLNILDKDI